MAFYSAALMSKEPENDTELVHFTTLRAANDQIDWLGALRPGDCVYVTPVKTVCMFLAHEDGVFVALNLSGQDEDGDYLQVNVPCSMLRKPTQAELAVVDEAALRKYRRVINLCRGQVVGVNSDDIHFARFDHYGWRDKSYVAFCYIWKKDGTVTFGAFSIGVLYL